MSSIVPPTTPASSPPNPGPARAVQTPGNVAAVTLGAIFLGLIAGFICGMATGFALFEIAVDDNSNGWEALGDALLAFALGVVVGLVVYCGAAMATVVHWIPTTQRAWPMVAVCSIPAVLILPIFFGIGIW